MLDQPQVTKKEDGFLVFPEKRSKKRHPVLQKVISVLKSEPQIKRGMLGINY